MATRTARFTANSTFVKIADGPMAMTIQPLTGFSDLFINTANTVSANEANTWLLKPVAGENHLDVTLASGEKLWIKAHNGVTGSTICWIEA